MLQNTVLFALSVGAMSSKSIINGFLVSSLLAFIVSFVLWEQARYVAHVSLIVACFLDSKEMLATYFGRNYD